MSVSLITRDDLQTLYSVFRARGLNFLLTKLKLSGKKRVINQWDTYQTSGSNWWEIPEVRQRWNFKITGNKLETWEEYVIRKYIVNRADFKLLSVGCGTGEKERMFARYAPVIGIEGIDISAASVKKAIELSVKENIERIVYHTGDFKAFSFTEGVYDIVLFNSSLHHFSKVEKLIYKRVMPLLKPGGLVVMFEYVGPNRFQYTNSQMAAVNHCLSLLPRNFKVRRDNSVKNKTYRPGWLRMWLNDPSEAPCSEEIIPVLRKHVIAIEEKALGGTLLHPLLKGIAHNFLGGKLEAEKLLDDLFCEEDRYMEQTGQSDFWFGVYGKKN